jgi:hypothetical protein
MRHLQCLVIGFSPGRFVDQGAEFISIGFQGMNESELLAL